MGLHLGVNTLFHVPGDVGGTETYLKESLLAIVSEFQDHKLTLFTSHDNENTLREWLGTSANITFHLVPVRSRVRPLRIIAEQLLLPGYVRNSGIDVLWSPGYTAPFFSSCPQVVTIHDLQYKVYPEDMVWLERVTLDMLVRMACKRCNAIIAVSEFSRQQLLNYGFAETEKVHAVLEGVNPLFGEFLADDSLTTELTGKLATNQPYILCVAHSYPHKNLDLLVRAFGKLMGEVPHNLVIVGKPRLGEAKLERAIDDIFPGNRLIRLKSSVSFDTLRLLYQKSDLFVLPSNYEGFGLPVLEAMMAETPVISSKAGALEEVTGNHAFHFEEMSAQNISQKVLEVLSLDDETKRNHLLEARRWAESFTWSRSVKEMFRVINSVNS